MSLKSTLNQIIKDRNGGVVSLKEIYDFCDRSHYKHTNAERRLRHSDSPDITPVYNEKRTAIIGYKYEKNRSQENPTKQAEKITVPSHSETRPGKMRPLWDNSGTISGPYISHRPIPTHGMDNH